MTTFPEKIKYYPTFDGVRHRPEMYIGSREHHQLCTLFEYLLECPYQASSYQITIYEDDSLEIADDGVGLSISSDNAYEMPYLEAVLLHCIELITDNPRTINIPVGFNLTDGKFFTSKEFGTPGYSIAFALSEWIELYTHEPIPLISEPKS